MLGALAVLSQVLLLWQWRVARRFAFQRSAGLRSGAASEAAAHAPSRSPVLHGITLLKPLNGADEHTAMCLRSWLAQNYPGPVQVLFGVASEDDPACVVVRRVLAKFPQRDAQLVICLGTLGANPKVSKLIQLERLAKHSLLCVSDADVCAPADWLSSSATLLEQSGACLVNSFYRLANPVSLAMRCEAVAVNADFWSQVLMARSLKPMDFALGAAMLMRRGDVTAIGGFTAIADHLADDFQLGRRLAQRGGRIAMSPMVVECWDAPAGWAGVWRHQLRWARTIRACQPLPYFFSVLSNATFWPLLWAVTAGDGRTLLFLGAALVARGLVTLDLQSRLGGKAESGKQKAETFFWLAPVKDLLQMAVWFSAFTGNTVAWRGRRMRVKRDGTLGGG